MAIARWRMIREIISSKKSGTLILQMGPHYIHFVLEEGNLIFVSSTYPEFTFSFFLIQNLQMDSGVVLQAESEVTDVRSLGAVLAQNHHWTTDALRDMLQQHWLNLGYFLLQSNTHAFWSNRMLRQKTQMINADLPLSNLLLRCERNSIEVQSALRFLETVPERCKVIHLEPVEEVLRGVERRILPYLKAGSTLNDILKDPEMDRMTCYRILFQLWVSGYLQDGTRRPKADPIVRRGQLIDRIRSLPPDWIIPLAVGMLLGVLLAPHEPLPSTPPTPRKIVKPWDVPAWQEKDKGDKETGGD
jgi:hypothetical protein